MKWFIDAAKKLQAKGVKEISVVSETITTHEYESKTLAKAFEEITGIKVKHDLIQEGDVVEKLQTSMQSGKSIYDGWISDSDLIGTHYRYGKIMNLTDYMAGKGKEYTNPGLDLKDFIGTSSPPRRTASCTSCPTSSSPTCTGSAPTCSRARTCRTSSRPSTATTWACR
jgi:glycerol transport system substrate-binding protein